MKPSFLKIFFLIAFVLTNGLQSNEPQSVDEVKKIFDGICNLAREHMRPDLGACNDLQCVEDLAYKDERRALDGVFKEHNTYFNSLFWGSAKLGYWLRDFNRYAFSWLTRHDEKGLGKALVETTKQTLRNYNIDPNSIDIVRDDKDCDLEQGIALSNVSSIAFDVSKLNDMSNHNDVVKHIIAHEATHIKEGHSIKESALRAHIATPGGRNDYLDFLELERVSKTPSFLRWKRSIEKQANLFPLTRFGDQDLLSGAFKVTLSECVEDYKMGTLKDKLHTSPKDATHPSCAEMLPFLVRIYDLKKRSAQPLYEKRKD